MLRAVSFSVSALALVLAFAGCGGGGASSAMPPSSGGGASLGRSNAAMTFHFPPPSSTASGARSPRYLSADTKSVVITITAVNGTPPSPAIPPTTLAVAPGQGTCTALTAQGFSCTATVGAVGGNDTFLIQAYGGANGTGSLLSSGSVTVAVASSGTTTVATQLVLSGNATSFVVASPSPNPAIGVAVSGSGVTLYPIADGAPHGITVTVAMFDASNSEIVGPIASPIPVAVSGSGISLTSSAFASGTTDIVQSPAQITATLTASYTGQPGGTITPSGAGSITIGVGGVAGTVNVVPFVVATASPGPANLVAGGFPQALQLQEAGATSFTIAGIGTTTPATIAGPPSTCTANGSTLTCTATNGVVSGLTLVPNATISGSTNFTIGDGHGANFNLAASVAGQAGGTPTFPTSYAVTQIAVTPPPGSFSATKLGGIALGPDGQTLYTLAVSSPGPTDAVNLLAITSNGCSSAGCAPTLAAYPQPTPEPTAVPATNGFLNPNPGFIALGGDGNLWVADTKTDALTAIGLPCNATTAPPCVLAQGSPTTFTMPGSGAPYNAILGASGSTIVATNDSNATDLAGLLTASTYAGFPPFGLNLFPPSGGPVGPVTGLAAAAAPSSVASYGATDVYAPAGSLLDALAPAAYQVVASYELGSGTAPTGTKTISACATGGVTISGTIAQTGAIATDAQGNLWLSALTNGSATPANAQVFVEIAPLSSGLCGKAIVPVQTTALASQIVLGPDGNLWYIVPGVAKIYRLAPTLLGTATPAVSAFPQTSLNGTPIELAPGGDGNIWFTETGGTLGALELH
uniref:Uncharacterized protein n=1 Tax=mine drainage metagenome TaxID=410659 RepID=E6PFD6_9ZZZZ